MTRKRTLGLCCAGVVGVTAIVPFSASAALPEFVGPFPAPFAAKSGVMRLETVKGALIACTSDTGSGEVTGPKTGSVTVTLSGCEFVTLGLPCNTVGLPPGEVVTAPLVLTLGYINEPKKEAGVDLSTATGAPLLKFMCGPLETVVVGSVIGKITPVNKVLKPPAHFMLKFAEAGGIQKPSHFEGGPLDVLSTSFGGGPFAESGLAGSDTLAFPVPMMVVA